MGEEPRGRTTRHYIYKVAEILPSGSLGSGGSAPNYAGHPVTAVRAFYNPNTLGPDDVRISEKFGLVYF